MSTHYWHEVTGDTGAISLGRRNVQLPALQAAAFLKWNTSGSSVSDSGTMAEADITRRMANQATSITLSNWAKSDEAVRPEPAIAAQIQKNAAAIRLINRWLADESGYDERVWPTVRDAIEANRLSDRSRFGD